jgi:hypothetical protein
VNFRHKHCTITANLRQPLHSTTQQRTNEIDQASRQQTTREQSREGDRFRARTCHSTRISCGRNCRRPYTACLSRSSHLQHRATCGTHRVTQCGWSEETTDRGASRAAEQSRDKLYLDTIALARRFERVVQRELSATVVTAAAAVTTEVLVVLQLHITTQQRE